VIGDSRKLCVVVHAVRQQRGDTIASTILSARVYSPTFGLTGIIPCRDSLHSFSFFSTYTLVYKEREAHNHDIKRNEDPTLSPVCLGICHNVVDEEARADKEDYFEEILAAKVSFLY
jgi:hypothetical protein